MADTKMIDMVCPSCGTYLYNEGAVSRCSCGVTKINGPVKVSDMLEGNSYAASKEEKLEALIKANKANQALLK